MAARGLAIAAMFLAMSLVVVAAGTGNMPTLDFDPYEVLKLERTATKAAIRRSFRALSLKLHPDKNPGDEAAKAEFTRVSLAYEVLGDSDKRAIYDQFGQEQYTSRWEYVQKTGGRTRAGDFYGPDTNVLPVNQQNFTQSRDYYMLVEFYAPWCVHCQNMAGEYRRAALLLDGIAHVGAVNCERQQMLCRRTNIRSYPALFLYPTGSAHQSPEPFRGEHTADAIADFVEQVVNPATVALTQYTFERTVMESSDMWVVAYTTPWCGPCRATKPHLRQLAFELRGLVKVGLVDCEASGSLCNRNSVRFYPYIVLYPRGDKASFENGRGVALEYDGGGPQLAVSLVKQVLRVALHGVEPAVGDSGRDEDEEDLEDFYRDLDEEEL